MHFAFPPSADAVFVFCILWPREDGNSFPTVRRKWEILGWASLCRRATSVGHYSGTTLALSFASGSLWALVLLPFKSFNLILSTLMHCPGALIFWFIYFNVMKCKIQVQPCPLTMTLEFFSWEPSFRLLRIRILNSQKYIFLVSIIKWLVQLFSSGCLSYSW